VDAEICLEDMIAAMIMDEQSHFKLEVEHPIGIIAWFIIQLFTLFLQFIVPDKL
jgi:hypothetical protein